MGLFCLIIIPIIVIKLRIQQKMETSERGFKRVLFLFMHKCQQNQRSSIFTIIPNWVFQVLAIITILPFTYNNPFLHNNDFLMFGLSRLRNFIHIYTLPHYTLAFDPITVGIPIIFLVLLIEVLLVVLAIGLKESFLRNIFLEFFKRFKLAFSLTMNGLLISIAKESFSSHFYVSLLSSLILILTTLTELTYLYFNFFCFFRNSSKGARNFSLFPLITEALKKIILLYVVLRGQIHQPEAILIEVVVIGLYLLNIGSVFVKKINYFDQMVDQIDIYQNSFLVSFFLFFILRQFTVLIDKNFIMVTLSLWFWSSWALKNYFEFIRYQILIKDTSQLSNPIEATCYLRFIDQLFTERHHDRNSMILAGIIKEHISKCKNVACICKNNESASKSVFKNEKFVSVFIQIVMKEIEDKFNDLELKISFLIFRVEVLKETPKFFYTAKFLRLESKYKSQFTLKLQYSLYRLKQLAVKEARKEEEEASIKKIIMQEKNLNSIKKQIGSVCRQSSEIFEYNTRSSCNMNILKDKMDTNYESLKTVYLHFEQAKKSEIASPEFLIIFMFYFQMVMFSFNNLSLIKERLLVFERKLNTKEISLSYFIMSICTDQGCILESLAEPDKIGIISNCSKNSKLIFMKEKKQILGSNVSDLIPQCLGEEHKRICKVWVETGKGSNVVKNQLKKAFFKSSNWKLVQGIIRLNVAIIDNELRIYVGVMRENQNDFMVVDPLSLKVEGFGNKFKDMMPENLSQTLISDVIPSWALLARKMSKPVSTVLEMREHESKNSSSYFRASVKVWKERMGEKELIVIQGKQIESRKGRRTNFEEETIHHINIDASQVVPEKGSSFCNANAVNKETSTSSNLAPGEYSLRRIMEQYSFKAYQCQKIQHPALMYTTAALVLILIVISIILVTQVVLYSYGLYSFNEVVFADGAVSDNMQLLEFLYNKVTMFYQYCGEDGYNPERCDFVKTSSQEIEVYLYDLMALDIEYLMANNTFLGNPYFFYEFVPIDLVLGEKENEIGSFQFMEYFVHSTRKIRHILSTEGRLNNETDYIYENLRTNWPEMKRINHLNLDLYEAVGSSELQIVTIYEYCLLAASILLYAILIPIFYFYDQRNQELHRKFLFLYRFIPSAINQSLMIYYKNLESQIDSIQTIEDIREMQPPNLEDKTSPSHYSYTFTFSKSLKIIICILWLLFNLGSVLMIFNMVEIFPSCTRMLRDINNLMDSQNYLLENFFELKSEYLFEPTLPNYETFKNELFKSLEQDQTVFSNTALSANTVFEASDENFKHQFSDILVKDVCKLTSDLFSESQRQKCFNGMHHKLLEEGLISSMQYFQRIVYQAMIDMNNSSIDPHEYFKREIFEDLDDYIFYMFRLYQATQARMNDGLINSIDSQINLLAALTSIMILFFVGTIVVWVLRVKKEKGELSRTYGYMLIYPVEMIKDIKIVQQTMIRNI